jgi:hypothetical protein
LNTLNLARLHIMHGDLYGKRIIDGMMPIRLYYQGVLIGNMG